MDGYGLWSDLNFNCALKTKNNEGKNKQFRNDSSAIEFEKDNLNLIASKDAENAQ